MNRKQLLLGMIVILFLVLPAATTAKDVHREYDTDMFCPKGAKTLGGISMYNSTDYAFDNYTVSDFSLNISADSLLDVRISKRYNYSDYVNYTWYDLWRGQSFTYALTEADLFSEDEVYYPETYKWTSSNSTHTVTGYGYYIIFRYLMLEIENIGDTDSWISISQSMTVETHGDRENTVNVTVRQPGNNYFSFPPGESSIIDDLDEAYYYIEASKFNSIIIGTAVLSGTLCALAMLAIQSKYAT